MKRKLKPRAAAAVEALSAEDKSLNFVKKQRSELPRRRRTLISPIIQLSGPDSLYTSLSEVSCDSSIASVRNQNQPKFRSDLPRIITRSYYRKKFKNASGNCDQAPELSDISCVESCSGENGDLKLKNRYVEKLDTGSEEVTKFEVSRSLRHSCSEISSRKAKENATSVDVTQNEVVLMIPAARTTSGKEIKIIEAEKDNSLASGRGALNSGETKLRITANRTVSKELRLSERVPLDIDLTCSEQFPNGGIVNGSGDMEEVCSSSSSEIFHVISDSEFGSSEYTPSFWGYASGSQFSENSVGGEGSSSPTFELFKQFKGQFCRSSISLRAFEDQNLHEIYVMGLEDEQDEESYRLMWKRERRQEYVHDYAEEYCIATAYGDLVIQQRLRMVHWIIEEATNKELRTETMFLGVNLFDRFMSKGYFEHVRNLQIAGIACLTLATRIEENQPDNCIRRMTFDVGGTIYIRCEVVAMEWLVQEVLNFQCFLPTMYNFLWYYLKAARANEKTDKTAKYLAVLTLMGHQQLCYWPSTVAAGLVILASIAANQDASFQVVTSIHARNKDYDLPKCIKSMEWLAKYL